MKFSYLFFFLAFSFIFVTCKDAPPKTITDLEIVPSLKYFKLQDPVSSIKSCGFNMSEERTELPDKIVNKYKMYRFDMLPLWRKEYKLEDDMVHVYAHKFWKMEEGYLLLYSTTMGNDDEDFMGVEARVLRLDVDGSVLEDQFFAAFSSQEDGDRSICQTLKVSPTDYVLTFNETESENVPLHMGFLE